jgi:hypothetical protein
LARRRGKSIGIGHKREPGRFLAIPIAFLQSRLYASLGRAAKTLLLDLGAQYNGSNNGKLIATLNSLKSRGWRSEPTLLKARRELERSRVIVETRKGGFPNKATWYGLAFFDLDWHPDYDIDRSHFTKGAWQSADAVISSRFLKKLMPPPSNSAVSVRSCFSGAKQNEAIATPEGSARTQEIAVAFRSSHLQGLEASEAELGDVTSPGS